MGRDWHGDSDGGGRAISSSKSRQKTNGCMSAFYHLFDFHHFSFHSHHHHHLTIDSPSSSKGLKLVDESRSSSTYKDQQSLNIPVTLRALTTNTCTLSSENCNSPNLVARLMGLDLLPHKTDLPNRHTLPKKDTPLGTLKSLPASPRISSARKSDFDFHRLSLQHDEFGCSRLKAMKQDQKENQSPRYHARQMVKQIKDRVVGMDITNSVKNREARPSQNTNKLTRDSTVSCSPRSRFSDRENKPTTIHKTNSRPQHITHKPKPSVEKQKQKRVKLRPINQCNKAENETRFSPPPIKPSPIKQPFFSEPNAKHKSKFKKITKSTGLPHKEVNETERPKWHEYDASICSRKENGPQVSASFSITCEKDYIARVLNLAGINTDSPVSSATTLDPSIFRKLEQLGENLSGSLGLRCNRMLLFDLVNEILIDTMELHAKRRRSYHRSELIAELCSAVASSVSVDVDHLLRTNKLEDEGEGVIAVIERDIIDALVRETASELGLKPRRFETTAAG